jgi:protein-disulfide isomerase
VKLYYKPFPIESHPGAHQCAEAAEWARSKGRFWAMHDALFDNPGARTTPDLADVARGIDLEPADLREALGAGRFAEKVRESQAEARAAGIRGTPTLFMNGRMLLLAEYSEEGLAFTLEDEEEWHAHHGWTRD